MMYSNKFAAAVLVNEKVLREFNKDTVYVPFGAEYALRLKNLNSARALVSITIDGANVTGGDLVLNAKSVIDFERSISNGNLDKGNKFKFIERTNAVEQHRGIDVEDGLIRIEYKFEQEYKPGYPWNYNTFDTWHTCPPSPSPFFQSRGIYKSASKGSLCGGVSLGDQSYTTTSFTGGPDCWGEASSSFSGTVGAEGAASSQVLMNSCVNEAGITVPGSVSNQQFHTVASFSTDGQTHVLVVRLLGQTENGRPVPAPITVKMKQTCSSCGHVNKATSKFCSECGTGLEII